VLDIEYRKEVGHACESLGMEPHMQSEHRTARESQGHYTGECWVDTILETPVGQGPARTDETIRVYSVFFTPGDRTDWHIHSKGQFIFVTGGEGRMGNENECSTVRAGDCVYFGPNERHWHGASPDHFLMNIVISMGTLVYDHPVTDEQYTRGF